MKHSAGAILSSIKLDRSSRKGVGVQLYMALRDIILSGGLRAGDRLPATRILARELGVSRTTVIDAIERLVVEGMLVSRVGAGTFVSDALDAQRPAPGAPQPAKTGKKPRLSYAITHAEPSYARRNWLPHEARAFITALPALDAFPMTNWARISARQLRGSRSAVMGYGEPKGMRALRRAIATHLSALKGIRCHEEQIFITCGAQHGFALIGHMLLNPGDRVWMENPGASGARNAFLSQGAELVPVDVDDEGMVVADGLKKSPHFRLAFVTPTHQQPLGHVMSLARRFELLRAAEEAQGLVIEDDYDGEFYFDNAPQPALYSTDTAGRVLYVGTFSKSLFPALRLGFILVPERMIDAFDQTFSAWASGPATATQAIVADFMDEGHFATHIRLMRRLYKARYEALREAAASLPEIVRLQETRSGFHATADLAPHIDAKLVVEQARERGVILAPLSRYCLQPIEKNGLVLGFGSAPPEELRKGIDIVRDLPALKSNWSG
ncbi:PLP-dependent aminotransferase family protein [Martelella endophytica]|uniref:GntR family transcriptional regulator n=1 Tax=Martelella endophytica TaxID=1486262 RepID=A0A0D5LP38_MAREN|nr:PLP-dependent aminotransferase family protein [Martelella endophytica]AJY45881.1 GntR family transcriptional regulator [Martelella endophytica]